MFKIDFKDVSAGRVAKGIKLSALPNGSLVTFDSQYQTPIRPKYMVMKGNEYVNVQKGKIPLIDLDSWEFDASDDWTVFHVWDNKGVKIDIAKWNWGNVN